MKDKCLEGQGLMDLPWISVQMSERTNAKQKDLSKVFDRFYRCDEARKSQTSGHGLGLSIARIIVAAHGGKLKVRSKVGAGTTFSVWLPLENE